MGLCAIYSNDFVRVRQFPPSSHVSVFPTCVFPVCLSPCVTRAWQLTTSPSAYLTLPVSPPTHLSTCVQSLCHLPDFVVIGILRIRQGQRPTPGHRLCGVCIFSYCFGRLETRICPLVWMVDYFLLLTLVSCGLLCLCVLCIGFWNK